MKLHVALEMLLIAILKSFFEPSYTDNSGLKYTILPRSFYEQNGLRKVFLGARILTSLDGLFSRQDQVAPRHLYIQTRERYGGFRLSAHLSPQDCGMLSSG